MTIVHLSGNKITGTSGDSKPTLIATNSIFVETDTNKTYKFNGSAWVRLDEGVGDSVTESEISGTIATTKLTGSLTSVASHGLATSATTDTTNAANISSGTLNTARIASLDSTKLTGTVSNDRLSSIPLAKIANGTAGKGIGFNATTGVIEEQTAATGTPLWKIIAFG